MMRLMGHSIAIIAIAFCGSGCAVRLSTDTNDPDRIVILDYFADRGKDFCDILTLDAGIGMGAQWHAQITQYCQLGFGGKAHGRLAGALLTPFWEYKRHWGMHYEQQGQIAVGPLEVEKTIRKWGRFGGRSEGLICTEEDIAELSGLVDPIDDIYEEDRDFWAISVTGGVISPWPVPYNGADVQVEFHPVEFIDFFAGWFGADISDDD